MHPIVHAGQLVKRYASGNVTAVDRVDFQVRERECFGFLGPNGAGKTTTMRMISCRAQRTGGTLEVLGLDPANEERAIKARIGVVPQETNLDGGLNLEENLITYARYFGVPRAQARARSAELLAFVQLEDRATWHVESLSGGMKRRLLIARALVNQPRLLILDEPTTGLDPQARHLVWDKLRELKRSGVTLIVTTHYMEEATQLCDRLVIMHQGKILVEGPPAELIAEHVAPEVVELTAGDAGRLEEVANLAAPHIAGYEIAGDRIILHTEQPDVLMKTLNESTDYESATVRPATLEDVFLHLTGRRLEE